MIVQAYPDFNKGTDGVTIPRGRFVAIHPSSLCDSCYVGAYRLGVRSVVPWAQNVRPARNARLPIATTDDINPLVLEIFEDGDPVIAPGPRAPVVVEAMIKSGGYGTLVTTATVACRLPMQGRRQATIFVLGTAAVDINVVVRGYRYSGRDILGKLDTFGAAFKPAIDETSVVWQSTNVSAVDGTIRLGKTIHVGGGADFQEAYDEIEILVWGANGTDAAVVATGYGESAE